MVKLSPQANYHNKALSACIYSLVFTYCHHDLFCMVLIRDLDNDIAARINADFVRGAMEVMQGV